MIRSAPISSKPSEASNALDAAVKSITSPESASPETSAPRCRVRPIEVTVAKESNFISQLPARKFRAHAFQVTERLFLR